MSKRVDPYLIGAVAVGLFAALLQSYRVGAPLSGYHGYNESYYFTFALGDLTRGALAPVLAPQDMNNPFFFPLLLATALRVFGPSIAVARAISIAASFAAVLLTYWVGKRLYDQQSGLLAAAAIAASPGLLLTGRNIQLDPLMLMLELAAIGAYLKATEREDTRWAAASGLLFGLGMLTKLPVFLAVIALAVWQVWRTRSWRWVTMRSTWVTALVAGLTAAPWYLYSVLGTSAFAAAQEGLLGRTGRWNGIAYLLRYVFGEQFWMLSPVLAGLAVIGLVLMAFRRSDADKLVLALVLVHSVVFLWNNKHSYYFMPLLPWASLAAARAVRAAGARTTARIVLAAVLLLALILPFSVAELSAKKWSMLRLDKIPSILSNAAYQPDSTVPLASAAVLGGLGPAVDYYLSEGHYLAAAALEDWRPTASDSKRYVALAGSAVPARGAKEVGVVPMELVSPVVFGWAVRSYPGETHYFALGWPEVVRVGPPWRFGVDLEGLPERVVVVWSLPGTPSPSEQSEGP